MIVSMLAGLGHRLRHLLRAAGLAKSTYYHLLSHPAAVTRPDIEPMVAEIFARTPNGCGHRQIRMCLVHEFGVRVSHKSVLKVMRHGPGMPDTQAEPVPEIQLVRTRRARGRRTC